MPSTAAWVDTGFLVALFARNDAHFTSAVEFLAKDAQRLKLHSLWPVVAEACFFLDTPGKVALLDWLEREPILLHELTVAELPAIRATLQKYHDLAPDFTDAVLATLGYAPHQPDHYGGRAGFLGVRWVIAAALLR